jgi:hypothetical protein
VCHADPFQHDGGGVSVCHSLNSSKLDITRGIPSKHHESVFVLSQARQHGGSLVTKR